MSDRPCNLQEHRRREREYGDRMEINERDDGWTDWYVDGRLMGAMMRLPTDANVRGLWGHL